MRTTYSEGTELAGAALLEDGEDLGNLARDAQDTSASLEVAQGLHVDNILSEESSEGTGKRRDEDGSEASATAVVEDEDGYDDVLTHDQGRLAKGAEGEAIADVVRERDNVGSGLEEVGEEGDAVGRARVDQLEDLRHLDDGRGGDDADAKTLGDAELDAVDILEVDVEEQRRVARLSDDGDAEVADRRGEVVRDGLDGGAEGVHGGVENGTWLVYRD